MRLARGEEIERVARHLRRMRGDGGAGAVGDRHQPFLGALAGDPSLRGVMDSLSTALLGISQGQAKLSDLDVPMTRFGKVLTAAAHGQRDCSARDIRMQAERNSIAG